MSKWIVDIHGDIEGDYDIIGEYAEPKTGHWIIDKGSLDAFYGEVCKCSECGVESIGESDYCPYCGCRMVEPQESEAKTE